MNPFFCVLLAVATSPARSEVTYLNKWGSEGGGDGQFYNLRRIDVAPNGGGLASL